MTWLVGVRNRHGAEKLKRPSYHDKWATSLKFLIRQAYKQHLPLRQALQIQCKVIVHDNKVIHFFVYKNDNNNNLFKFYIYTVPPLGNKENAWITDLICLWNEKPISILPTHKVGKEIINALIEHPKKLATIVQGNNSTQLCSIGRPTFATEIQPSLQMPIRDLIEADKNEEDCNALDYVTCLAEPGVRADKFLACLNEIQEADVWTPNLRLLGFLDIPFSDTGMGLCDPLPVPYHNDPTFSFNPMIQWKNQWSTCVTPPGSISHMHSDGIGCAQYMIHIWGKKLWLF
jgi:hypothetical protein